MEFNPCKCPDCGEVAVGTIEVLHGRADLIQLDDGSFEYGGETEVFWDGQMSVRDKKGRVQMTCDKGHEWFAVRKDD